MILGAAGLAAVVAVNWNTISSALQGPIGIITALISGALLVVGAVLTFSGANIPLGIALMAIGAAGLAATAAVNWDTISNLLQGPIGKIIAIVSGALLVLGILLVCTGVGIPLGIALILAGAAGLVTTAAVNWDAILDKIKGVWDKIKAWWDSTVLPVFTVAFWQNIFSCIVEAFDSIWDGIKSAADSIKETFLPLAEWFRALFEGIWLIIEAVWITAADWFNNNVVTPIIKFFSPIVETIGNFFTTLWDDIKAIFGPFSNWFSANVTGPLVEDFGTAFKAISEALESIFGGIGDFLKNIFNGIISGIESGINAVISALNAVVDGFNSVATWAAGVVGTSYGGLPRISNVSLPRLATGAVIPPNQQFLAMLGDQKSGTNIEAPESLIRKIVREESSNSGGRIAKIEFTGDLAQLGRVLKPVITYENTRAGESFVSGGR